MALKKAPGLIPAVDMPLGKAIVYIDKLKGLENEITGLKIGSEIVDEFGLLVTNHLLEQIDNEYPVILDLQKRGNDVPEFIRRQVGLAKKYAVCSYIGHPVGSGSSGKFGDKEMGSLQAFVGYCKENDIEPVIVLELTSPGSGFFLREGAREDLARKSKELGVKYFVAPATRPERIKVYRKIIGEDAEIISPGVGPQKTGDPVKDAVEAVYAGADHLVIGRALYNSSNPPETAKTIFDAVYEAYMKRKGL